MGERTGFNCVKYAFFAFNAFVFLLGTGVFTLGIWLQFSRAPHIAIVPSHSLLSASALCIIAGAIVLSCGCLGSIGAFYENQCMLIGYFIVVLLIFTLEITAGTLSFIHKDEIRAMVQKDLLLSIQQDYHLKPDDSTERVFLDGDVSHDPEKWWEVVDNMQEELECCGVVNYSDWFNIQAWPTERRVPDSCCKQPHSGCGRLEPKFWFDRGCMSEIDYWFVKNMYILGIVGITVAVVQILAMVASVIVFCYIRNNRFFL